MASSKPKKPDDETISTPDHETTSSFNRIYEKLTPEERERVVQGARRALDFQRFVNDRSAEDDVVSGRRKPN